MTFPTRRRWLAAAAGVTTGLIPAVVIAAEFKWLDGVKADPSDPAKVERGRYIANGPAHCTACHSGIDGKMNVEGRLDVPLAGGVPLEAGPLGMIYAPNLTSDPDTGLGKVSDYEIARALRYNIKRDGGVLPPVMPFRHMSDEDMSAVLSYLRTLPPTPNKVPPHKLTPLGWVAVNFMLKPMQPEYEPPKATPKGPSVELGKYLAENVANCAGCHTKLDMATLSYSGPIMAGGSELDAFGKPGWVVVSKNLTPDPKTGHIYNWSEDAFVARFKSGAGLPETHMPWAFYKNMTEDDLRSIYRYLKTLPPAENDTGPALRQKT
ncbi:MAG: c-type cytochrome [Candidatus Sericytochromatia bacterium]|nr:c-type cytochrome [Candidatus Tanganyikabacteria bacterium]